MLIARGKSRQAIADRREWTGESGQVRADRREHTGESGMREQFSLDDDLQPRVVTVRVRAGRKKMRAGS